jgi:molybdenum cofactor biosynthesis protein B
VKRASSRRRTPAARRRTPAARRGAHAARAAGDRAVRCAVLTVSDTRRARADSSGELAERLIIRAGHQVVARGWVSDDRAGIRRAARAMIARTDVDALIVTGGTGVAPRDVTPEAMTALFETRLPGFGEIFRMLSFDAVGTAAWMSRAEAGIANGRLVCLLPGSPAAVGLALERVLLPEIAHVMRTLGRFSRP